MRIDDKLFDQILELAKESPRKRMHYDMRTQAMENAASKSDSWFDNSQRILNVMLPETQIPIHRHNETAETVVICRGSVRIEFYDSDGLKLQEHVLTAGSNCVGVQIPRGMYHTCVCLIPGSVIFEAKDRPYDPEKTEEFLVL